MNEHIIKSMTLCVRFFIFKKKCVDALLVRFWLNIQQAFLKHTFVNKHKRARMLELQNVFTCWRHMKDY